MYLAVLFNDDLEHIVFINHDGEEARPIKSDKIVGIWELVDNRLEYTKIDDINQFFRIFVRYYEDSQIEGFDNFGYIRDGRYIVGVEHEEN